jgi:hypothetical protein
MTNVTHGNRRPSQKSRHNAQNSGKAHRRGSRHHEVLGGKSVSVRPPNGSRFCCGARRLRHISYSFGGRPPRTASSKRWLDGGVN